MVSYALKTTTSVALVIALSLGAAWLASLGTGPVVDPEVLGDDRPPATRVEYRSSERVLQSPVVDIPTGGSIQLPALDVPLANVSKVRVNLRAVTDDPAFGDTFDVAVTAPDEDARQGTLASPQVSPSGYQISNRVVEDWSRTVVPPRENYETRSQHKALRWAAENHTDTSSRGLWQMSVELQPPPAGMRNVNVTLTFTFTVYEAFAFPRIDTDAQDGGNNTTTEVDDSTTTGPLGTKTPIFASRHAAAATFLRPHQNPLETDPRGALH